MIAAKELPDDGLDDVRMLNVADLARCLRISVRQCWRLNKNELLPAPQRLGGITRWRAIEIANWQEAGMPERSKWEQQQATQTVGDENA